MSEFIDQFTRKVRSLPKWHPVRVTLRALKYSPEVIAEKPIRNYLLYQLRKPLTIVVAGMFRSGTSFVTRAISLLGARVGDDLPGGGKGNPKGYWEHLFGLHINRMLLQKAGGKWDSPPQPDNIRSGILSSYKIKRFVSKLHDKGNRVGVFKDPRNALTLHIWREELKNYVPIFVFRHPMSVADSIERVSENRYTKKESLELWKLYNKSILNFCKDERNYFIVDFDSGIKRINKKLKKISKMSKLKFSNRAKKFYDRSIRNCDKKEDIKRKEIRKIYNELKEKSKNN